MFDIKQKYIVMRVYHIHIFWNTFDDFVVVKKV